MFKTAVIILGICVLCKWVFGKWPWDYLRGGPTRSQAVSNARKLLAIKAGADRQEIESAHKRLVAMVHPDRGGTNAQVHEATAARDLLIDELPHERTPRL